MTDEDPHSISDRSEPYTPENKAEVHVPESCVDAEAGLALIPYVNHVGEASFGSSDVQ